MSRVHVFTVLLFTRWIESTKEHVPQQHMSLAMKVGQNDLPPLADINDTTHTRTNPRQDTYRLMPLTAITMHLPTLSIVAAFTALFTTTTTAWSITFYDSKSGCKGNGDRDQYTSYSGTSISRYIRPGDQGYDTECVAFIDGGRSSGECDSGPLNTHKLWFKAGSNTRCRWSYSGLNLDPSENRDTVDGEMGKCWSPKSAIGQTPDEFWFQCGEGDDPYWDD